jgi:hypothetical protein
MFLTPWHNGVLNSTFFPVIKNLIAGEMTFLSDLPCLFEIRNIEVAHAPGQNHSITLQLIEGRYRFLERILTAPVKEIAIQSVRLEPNQGPLASLFALVVPGSLTDHRDVTPRGSEMALFHTCPWLEINLLRIADLGRGLVVFACAYSE